ncbi:MAG: Trigger factor, partial [Bacteroidota bacterium]
MNVTIENIDELSAVVSVSIVEGDYKEVVTKSLKDYRRKANIPGFRAGNVPMGMIQKMYGKSVLVEQVFNLAHNAVRSYIQDEKIEILGEPLPYEHGNKLDFETDTEFVVKYEIGFSPKVENFINSDLKFNLLVPAFNDMKKAELVDSIRNEHGTFVAVESIEATENLRGTFVELAADGTALEGGINQENALVALQVVKDDAVLAAFAGKTVGDVVLINMKTAFPNDSDRAALLGVTPEVIDSISDTFSYTIASIERFTPGELNQELFNKVFGEGVVVDEDSFYAKLNEYYVSTLAPEADRILYSEFREWVAENVKLDLPVDFLKRWLVQRNENLTIEELDESFTHYVASFNWEIIRESIFARFGVEITNAERIETARAIVYNQFLQYGIPHHMIPEAE